MVLAYHILIRTPLSPQIGRLRSAEEKEAKSSARERVLRRTEAEESEEADVEETEEGDEEEFTV